MCRFTIRKLWVHRQSSCKLLRRTPTQLRVTLFQLQSEQKMLSLHMNSRCHFYPLSNPVLRFVVYFRCYKKKKKKKGEEEEKVLNNSGRLEKESFRARRMRRPALRERETQRQRKGLGTEQDDNSENERDGHKREGEYDEENV